MLEFAKKYEDQLKQNFLENVFNDDTKWLWLGTGRTWVEPTFETNEYHSFVSTHNGKAIGEMGYHKTMSTGAADGFYCYHFAKDNGFIFMKDLLRCLKDIFEKFGMNKLSYCVIVGNPMEAKWDKLTEKFGGQVVGIRRQDVKLQDGKIYDVKEYEVLAKDYFLSTANTIRKGTYDREKDET
jgi:hypothetical protein